MTGRELISYIMENHLEDEPVFQNGTFIGYVSDVKFAEMIGVGVATVHTWILLGRVKDAIMIGDTMLIPMIYANELQKQKIKGSVANREEIGCCVLYSSGGLALTVVSLKSEVKYESEIE